MFDFIKVFDDVNNESGWAYFDDRGNLRLDNDFISLDRNSILVMQDENSRVIDLTKTTQLNKLLKQAITTVQPLKREHDEELGHRLLEKQFKQDEYYYKVYCYNPSTCKVLAENIDDERDHIEVSYDEVINNLVY